MKQTIARNEMEAANEMESHRISAKHAVEVGDRGRDYFYGDVEIIAVDTRTVQIRLDSGETKSVYRDQWLGILQMSEA